MARKQDTRAARQGFALDEAAEALEAERMKGKAGTSRQIQYQDRDTSTRDIETYDKNSGKLEGRIHLGSKGNTGDLVPLHIIEGYTTHYEYNGEKDLEKDRKAQGQLLIKNPSSRNKIWDIDLSLKPNKAKGIDDKIHLKNLDPGVEWKKEYQIKETEDPALKITEFISTLNKEDTAAYTLSTKQANKVLFKVKIKNLKDYNLTKLVIRKEIPSGFENLNIASSSSGKTEKETGAIAWKMDSLAAGAEVELKYTMEIKTTKTDEKVHTGKITVEYDAPKSITGIEFDKFDAYSDNFVGMEIDQQENNPDKYTCSIMFKNESDFQMQLVNLDVTDVGSGKKVLDIDPSEIQPIASEASWQSVEWESEAVLDEETKLNMEPQFEKWVEFFLVSERAISTHGTIKIDDTELAVALMAGTLAYSINEIASFREVPFKVLHSVKNIGGADLNEVIFEETIQLGYQPPAAKDIALYIERPGKDTDKYAALPEKEPIDWEELGDPVDIEKNMIEITPNDQEITAAHTLRVKLMELKDSPIGMFIPGMIFRVSYPISAMRVAKDTAFESKVRYLGNTFPAGLPIEVIPTVFRIPVKHVRAKFTKGKKVHALEAEGQYEIILSFMNTGTAELTNLEIKDYVPHNFEYDVSTKDYKYKTANMTDNDLLTWTIPSVKPNDKIEIRYVLKGKGDYKASEAQFSA